MSQAESVVDTPVTISDEGQDVVENAQKLGDIKRLQIPPMGLHLLMPLQLQQTVLMPLRQLKQLPLRHLLLKNIPEDAATKADCCILTIARIQPVAKVCFEDDEVCDVTTFCWSNCRAMVLVMVRCFIAYLPNLSCVRLTWLTYVR